MKFYLGVTDNNWYRYLSQINPEDVNFWQPGGSVSFKVLEQGAPFLFKLKSPLNAISGVGFFASHTFLPMNMAWEAFGNRNGCDSYSEFGRMILNYRSDKENNNPTIGCIVLTNPIFFKENDWIEVPENWGKSIVQGKSYTTDDAIGASLWERVELLLSSYMTNSDVEQVSSFAADDGGLYGYTLLKKVRLGQGAFRVLVTDAYLRKCAISGEKTLPVLEAAHIKSYSSKGPNTVANGLLLRSDMHKLFDSGYLTITKDYRVEVSSRIKEEFNNGKEYYQYHGKELFLLPSKAKEKPDPTFIDWHNSNVYNG